MNGADRRRTFKNRKIGKMGITWGEFNAINPKQEPIVKKEKNK